ncbi:MAG: FliH/SctL family protein [Candidatus Acidiferrales bacterium]
MSKKKHTSSEHTAGATENSEAVSPYVYRPAPSWDPGGETYLSAQGIATAMEMPEADTGPTGGAPPEEKIGARSNESYEQGFREGMAKARAESEAALTQQRDAISAALKEFVHQRNEYFHHVEGEVVALALAIVRKILRRESQLDPLLLSGLVRVALEKTAMSQTARLRVNPSQIPIWQEYFLEHSDLPLQPELSGDAALEQHQCQLETELGISEINLETQLKEIEQGLFDLLAQRPAPR